jgi:glutaredoxin
MKDKRLIYYGVIAIVFIIIVLLLSQGPAELDEQTAECIASKSTLYVSATCGHCAKQKQDLEPYLDKFIMIDCTTSNACQDIRAVPTWLINGQQHTGVQSIEQLKELTSC